MSKNYKQVTYECRCTEPYNTICNKTSKFVFVQNCTIDLNSIYHQSHGGKWYPYNPGEYINDEEHNALKEVLNINTEGTDPPDESFWEYIKNKGFEIPKQTTLKNYITAYRDTMENDGQRDAVGPLNDVLKKVEELFFTIE